MLTTAIHPHFNLFTNTVATRWPIHLTMALIRRWERAENILEGLPQDKWAGVNPEISHLVPSSNGLDTYTVSLVDGCSCPDSIHGAPYGWCKHRLALWIAIRTARERPRMTEAQRDQELKDLFG